MANNAENCPQWIHMMHNEHKITKHGGEVQSNEKISRAVETGYQLTTASLVNLPLGLLRLA